MPLEEGSGELRLGSDSGGVFRSPAGECGASSWSIPEVGLATAGPWGRQERVGEGAAVSPASEPSSGVG